MEPQINEPESVIAPLKKVTPLSKYLAMTLFVVLPFIGGWIGYTYAPEKVVEVEKIVIQSESAFSVTKNDTDHEVSEFYSESSQIIDNYDFSWNGSVGNVKHECTRKVVEGSLIYMPSTHTDKSGVKFCSDLNTLSIEFNGVKKLLEEFVISTTSDYKRIEVVSFTQSSFSNTKNDSEDAYRLETENQEDKLLLGFHHQSCHWREDEVCYWGETLTHIISLTDLEVTELEQPIKILRGFSQMKWNPIRTAFVIRDRADDIQPTYKGYRLGSSDAAFVYNGLTLSYNADEWTVEENNFADRMWNDNEVEWLNEYQVRILDEVYIIE